MGLHPRHGRRSPRRSGGRFSLCATRVAKVDRHAVRRPAPRYGAILTGATLVASILVALAMWPHEAIALPGLDPGGDLKVRIAGRYTLDDFAARLH